LISPTVQENTAAGGFVSEDLSATQLPGGARTLVRFNASIFQRLKKFRALETSRVEAA
jgi:hypothetical protein